MRIFKNLLFGLFIFVVSGLDAATPSLLKHTHNCLQPKYQDYSLVHGAIAWETKFAKNLYERGCPKDATVKLVKRYLFHVAEGTFDIGREKSTASEALNFEQFGALVGVVVKSIASGLNQKKFVCNLYQSLYTVDTVVDELIALLDKKKRETKKKLKTVSGFLGVNEAIKKGKKKGVQLSEKNEKNFREKQKELKRNLKEVTKQFEIAKEKKESMKSEFARNEFNNFANLLYRSLQECGHLKSKKQLYFPNTTTNLLLAVLYRKMQSKQEYFEYLETFRETLNLKEEDFYNEDASYRFDSVWVNDKYKQDQADLIMGEIKSFFEKIDKSTSEKIKGHALSSGYVGIQSIFEPEFGDIFVEEKKEITTFFAENFERISFAELIDQFYKGSIPKLAMHVSNLSYHGAYFTDCCATAVRNIVNLMTYDESSLSFNADRLFGGKDKINNKIVKFYDKFSLSEDVDNYEIHREWNEIVSNVPGITYLTRVDLERNTYIKQGRQFVSGIGDTRVEDEEEISVGGEKLFSVNPDKYALTEISLNKSSLVVLFNYLLNLELFDNPIKAYEKNLFPALCEKLGWKVESEGDEGNYHFLIIDIGNKKRFKLRMTQEHSETMFLSSKLYFNEEKKKYFDFWLENYDKTPLSLPLVSLYSSYMFEKRGDDGFPFDEMETIDRVWPIIEDKVDGSKLFSLFYLVYPKIVFFEYIFYIGSVFSSYTKPSKIIEYAVDKGKFVNESKRLILGLASKYLYEYTLKFKDFLLEKGSESGKALVSLSLLSNRKEREFLDIFKKINVSKLDAYSRYRLIDFLLEQLDLFYRNKKKSVLSEQYLYQIKNTIFNRLITSLESKLIFVSDIDFIINKIVDPFYKGEALSFNRTPSYIKEDSGIQQIIFDLIEYRYTRGFDVAKFNDIVNFISWCKFDDFYQIKKDFLLKHKEKLPDKVRKKIGVE